MIKLVMKLRMYPFL